MATTKGWQMARARVPGWINIERVLAVLGLLLLVGGILAFRYELEAPGHPVQGPTISLTGDCAYGEDDEGGRGVVVPYVVEGVNDGETVLWLQGSFGEPGDDDPTTGDAALRTPDGEYSREGTILIRVSEARWDGSIPDSCAAEARWWEERPGA